MRREFIESLVSLAKRDPRVVLMTGDLGFAALEPFSEQFPKRFFNVGVAEQNMVGMATGMAEAGLIPYVYSIATFASMRAYEFIRNGAVVHDLPVRVVGVGEGADYSHNGITHYALEDIALMRVQPGMVIANPATAGQVAPMLDAIEGVSGPAYLRLSKTSARVAGLADEFVLGRAQRLGAGADVALISLGATAGAAVTCAQLLGERGIQASVLAVTSVAPPPLEDLQALLSGTRLALTVEAHYVTGGLGSLVAEVISEAGLDCRLLRAGARSTPVGKTGAAAYMNDCFGISAEALADRVCSELASRQTVAVS
jgi:transketolase